MTLAPLYPLPAPVAPALPAHGLRLLPSVAAVPYAATLSWEEFANGQYQCSTIEKQLRLQVQANAAGYVLDIRQEPPVLTKAGELEPLEEFALRLAALYAWLQLQLSPSGEVIALLNHAALVEAWQALALELTAQTAPADELTPALLAFVGRQVPEATVLLASLGADYLYQTLLPAGCYGPRPRGPQVPIRQRCFAHFWGKVSLYFHEQASLEAGDTADELVLRLDGKLDAQRTDLTAVRAAIGRALPAAPGLPSVLPALACQYQATYYLEAATGLPREVHLRVYARQGEYYNKEYRLTLTRL